MMTGVYCPLAKVMRFKKGKISTIVLDGNQLSLGLFVSICSQLGQGCRSGSKGTSVLAVGPRAMVKFVDVAKVAILLLGHKAKVNGRDVSNLIALHSATRLEHDEVVRLLLRVRVLLYIT